MRVNSSDAITTPQYDVVQRKAEKPPQEPEEQPVVEVVEDENVGQDLSRLI
jgi:hypothetical protein